MIRLLLRLCGIKDFEVCQSCETLKQQLSYERDEKKRLTDTLITIVSPKVIETPEPIELNPIGHSAASFSQRRRILEEKSRLDAKILTEQKNIGVADKLRDVEKLEQELGIEEVV
jgi:hypothetical protein